jgi:hypothetical protein
MTMPLGQDMRMMRIGSIIAMERGGGLNGLSAVDLGSPG